jgi:hypothetical protein
MPGRGAGDRPITYEGTYDPAVQYLPRMVVKDGTSTYLAVAKTIGTAPDPTLATPWLPMGSGGGLTGMNIELIKQGTATVITDLFRPGLRVPIACTLHALYLRLGLAPTGADLVMVVKVNGATVATLTVTAGTLAASNTALSVALAVGDIITHNITSVGSTIPGADIAIAHIAA